LVEAVDERTEVLRNRSPSEAFQLLDVKLTGRSSGEGPQAVISSSPGDFSVGNAKFGYQTLTFALTLGAVERARELCPFIWDPPDATYVGRGNYAVYDKSEQRVAYAARAIVAGDCETALATIGAVHASASGERVAAEIATLEALARSDAPKLLVAIRELLRSHADEATSPLNRNRPEYFLCAPAIAWSVWGCLSSLVDLTQLPRDDVYAPFGLSST
jgi:hypothetical protein